MEALDKQYIRVLLWEVKQSAIDDLTSFVRRWNFDLCGSNPEQLGYLKYVLLCFDVVSGLKINLSKFEMVRSQTYQFWLRFWTAKFLPCLCNIWGYLWGLVINLRLQELILEKMERRLAGWKKLCLSKRGRITLIKSTLSSLPTYFLSLFPIPVSVAHSPEKLQWDFVRGRVRGWFQIYLINWKAVWQPVWYGSLGVGSLVHFNNALLGKWLWDSQSATDTNSLWRNVAATKGGCILGDWTSYVLKEPYGVFLWEPIRRGRGGFHDMLSLGWVMDSVCFSLELWCGEWRYNPRGCFSDVVLHG